jgi:hypothetical protein
MYTVRLQALNRAPPELWPRLKGEEVRGLTSVAVPVDGTGTASVYPDGAAGPGRAKTSSPGRKTVPFASRQKGPGFNPQGGTYVKPGFSC